MVLHGVEAITTWIICHFSKTVPIEFTNVASTYFYQYWEGDEMKWKWWLLVTHSCHENNFFNSCCCNSPCVLIICVSFSEPYFCIFLGAFTYQYDGVRTSTTYGRTVVVAHQLCVSLSNFRQKNYGTELWQWIGSEYKQHWGLDYPTCFDKCWMNFAVMIK